MQQVSSIFFKISLIKYFYFFLKQLPQEDAEARETTTKSSSDSLLKQFTYSLSNTYEDNDIME